MSKSRTNKTSGIEVDNCQVHSANHDEQSETEIKRNEQPYPTIYSVSDMICSVHVEDNEGIVNIFENNDNVHCVSWVDSSNSVFVCG